MKVRALQLGYDNVALRQPGEEFEVSESVFEGGGNHFFEPVEKADKARVAELQKAGKRPEVPAVDPAKQAADHEAAVRALSEKHAAERKELLEEIEALKKGQAKTK